MKKPIQLFPNLLLVCLLFVTARGLQAQTQNWVYAGNPGQQGYAGDGYVAYQPGTIPNPVKFKDPYGLTVDAKGNLYISDVGSNVVRKVDANTHIITTVVGNGLCGCNGNGGIGGPAPNGIGGLGPGGPSASDSLFSPSALVYNPVDNCLYISQKYYISKFNLATNVLSPVAGSGPVSGQHILSGNGGPATAAGMEDITGLALSPDGEFLYEAEYFNAIVRKIDLTTGIITLFAGSNTVPHSAGGFSGDGGLATAAQLTYPYGLAVDAAGNVYIANSGNGYIRKVGTDGIITTIAGGGSVADSTVNVVATSLTSLYCGFMKVNGNNLVVATDKAVKSIDLTTNLITQVSGGYVKGFDVAFYGSKLYVLDSGSEAVYQVSSTGLPAAAGLTTGTIDCSKTQLVMAPITGTASQLDLVITVNITTAGCVGPVAVSGSGMSVANGVTEVCTASTGVQTFHIPLTYDGSALGVTTFSFAGLGNCNADLSVLPSRSVHTSTTFLVDCTPISPVLLSK